MNREQSFYDWVYNPNADDELLTHTFRRTVKYAFDNKLTINTMDVNAPDPDGLEWKLATLLYHKRITPEGNKIYVYRNGNLSPLPDGMNDLQHLLHETEKNTAKAFGLLSHELEGVTRNLVEKDTIGVIITTGDLFENPATTKTRINLRTMREEEGESQSMIPEFGWHEADFDRIDILAKFFYEQNTAFQTEDEYFFEKAISYSFHQRFREKAFICNGPGGVGKTLMTEIAGILYGSKGTVASEPTFTGQDRNRITRDFIGKKMVIYNDIEEPSVQLMTWIKPMATGNMTIKGEGGFEKSVPCEAVFYLETNFKPQFLGGNQDIRRFVVRTAQSDYKLVEHMTPDELDILGREITPADVAVYLKMQSYDIENRAGGWLYFEDRPLPIADFIEIAQEFFNAYPGDITKGVVTAYAQQNKLSKIELETLKEVLIVGKEKMEKHEGSTETEGELLEEDRVPVQEASGESTDADGTQRETVPPVHVPSVRTVAPDESGGEVDDGREHMLESLPILFDEDLGASDAGAQAEDTVVPPVSKQEAPREPAIRDESYLSDF